MIEENIYDVAIHTRKLINSTISELSMLNIDLNAIDDFDIKKQITELQETLDKQNAELKIFENNWM